MMCLSVSLGLGPASYRCPMSMHHPRTLLNLFDDRAELQIIFAQEEEILCGGMLLPVLSFLHI